MSTTIARFWAGGRNTRETCHLVNLSLDLVIVERARHCGLSKELGDVCGLDRKAMSGRPIWRMCQPWRHHLFGSQALAHQSPFEQLKSLVNFKIISTVVSSTFLCAEEPLKTASVSEKTLCRLQRRRNVTAALIVLSNLKFPQIDSSRIRAAGVPLGTAFRTPRRLGLRATRSECLPPILLWTRYLQRAPRRLRMRPSRKRYDFPLMESNYALTTAQS